MWLSLFASSLGTSYAKQRGLLLLSFGIVEARTHVVTYYFAAIFTNQRIILRRQIFLIPGVGNLLN